MCLKISDSVMHAAIILGLPLLIWGQPQTFTSGSTGADGALNITAPGVTYFSPSAMGLHPAVPNVFNFTTITIASGSTLKLTEQAFHGPAYFLASGNVDIEGTLDLSGANSYGMTASQSDRLPTYAGSGGYGGGLGGAATGTPTPQSGNGPGGGAAGTSSGTSGGNGVFTGNQYLNPLIGGSGGGGIIGCGTAYGPPGGAGGGAILIASSATITVNGTINANGGNPGNCSGNSIYSGAGSGGAIRLVANTISGYSGFLSTNGGFYTNYYATQFPGNAGRSRIEVFQNQSSYLHVTGAISYSTPNSLALPQTAPSSLTVTSINGVTINANPFSFPDATINTVSPVTINVQAQYVPVGTIPKIIVSSETGPDQTVNCSALAGTLQLSTCSAQVTFPTGGSRGYVKATW